MFTSNYSVIVDINKFQKIPTMLLLNIFQYLDGDELFIMSYNKKTKDLCLAINKNYPTITQSLLYKQTHPPLYTIYTYSRFTPYDIITINNNVLSFSIPRQGILREEIRYNNHNIIGYHNSFYRHKTNKKPKRRHVPLSVYRPN